MNHSWLDVTRRANMACHVGRRIKIEPDGEVWGLKLPFWKTVDEIMPRLKFEDKIAYSIYLAFLIFSPVSPLLVILRGYQHMETRTWAGSSKTVHTRLVVVQWSPCAPWVFLATCLKFEEPPDSGPECETQTQMLLHHPGGEASDHLGEHHPKISPPLPLLSRQTMRAQPPRVL